MRIGFRDMQRRNFHSLPVNRSLQKTIYAVYMIVLFGAILASILASALSNS